MDKGYHRRETKHLKRVRPEKYWGGGIDGQYNGREKKNKKKHTNEIQKKKKDRRENKKKVANGDSNIWLIFWPKRFVDFDWRQQVMMRTKLRVAV